ncbi:CKLF-like MARVEL transmembrane domain-containing protein 1 [Camelus dromedarius]|uniref:CKLF-like MARVEL transmembrane domain-containing protein 1 n=1 Tax=Camelus dromedarius TaxID=9838 RepID=A0A5N4DSA2_CAMDR|nr:CKLF-like MARVEL transmembrane domain-containing protein 1 [Camelus dromedarius]
MDPEAESAPLRGDWQAPARPGRSVRITPSARPARQAPTEPTAKPAGRPASPGEAEAAAVQKRAEGRAKVPRKFRDSFKRFFFSPTGALKIIRLALLIGALVYFIIAEAQEYFIAITVLETCIVVCFILIYMLTLHHLMTFLHWPLLSLCLTAAIVCLVDGTVVTKRMRNNVKKALGIESETEVTPIPAQETAPAPVKAPTRVPQKGTPKAPTKTAMKPRGPATARAPSEVSKAGTLEPPSQAPLATAFRRSAAELACCHPFRPTCDHKIRAAKSGTPLLARVALCKSGVTFPGACECTRALALRRLWFQPTRPEDRSSGYSRRATSLGLTGPLGDFRAEVGPPW